VHVVEVKGWLLGFLERLQGLNLMLERLYLLLEVVGLIKLLLSNRGFLQLFQLSQSGLLGCGPFVVFDFRLEEVFWIFRLRTLGLKLQRLYSCARWAESRTCGSTKAGIFVKGPISSLVNNSR